MTNTLAYNNCRRKKVLQYTFQETVAATATKLVKIEINISFPKWQAKVLTLFHWKSTFCHGLNWFRDCSRGILIEGEGSEAGLLNKSSCLAPTLGVTKFKIVTDMIWVTLCCAT